MLKRKIISLIAGVLLIIAVSSEAAAASFTDVPDDHPYKAAIDFCQAKGYVYGIGDTLFVPAGDLTRAQLAIIWSRFLGADVTNHHFSDIGPLRNYYDSAAIIMNAYGILAGTTDTTFSPLSNVTREQLATIVMRTFGIGVADENDYKKYLDYASISAWAQDAISACLNADVFVGLYDGENLQPQKTATRAEICKLIYNLSQPGYTITIGTLNGGKITALPSVAHPGTTITLTVTPDTGKRLKAGTLKFNDTVVSGRTFSMPAANVLITAEFEGIPSLLSISVTTPPLKMDYTAGETLDLRGLAVEAVYSDNATADVTAKIETTPAGGAVLNTEGANTITVSYSEGGITKTNSFIIQVAANASTSPT